MRRTILAMACIGLLAGAACDRTAPTPGATETPAPAPTPVAATASSPDAEIEQLKTVKPVDACALLTPEKLKAVYPDLAFEQHQTVAPQMSGYAWDSRCGYRAGVGTIEFAKDAPTHAVDIAVVTVVSEAKAQANLASRRELAKTESSYQAQPELGADAYTVTDTGMARIFFAKGQSEIQINLSELDSPNATKVAKIIALAKSL